MKTKRHSKILELISERDINTQEELLAYLRAAGFDVTQATVSRDIRDLKLVKIAADDHTYKYALSSHDEMRISVKYRNIIKETVTKIDYTDKFVVLKTYAGMAQAAAAAIDGMGWNEIVGSIAGDDTIFVLMRDYETALEFVSKFRKILKSDKS